MRINKAVYKAMMAMIMTVVLVLVAACSGNGTGSGQATPSPTANASANNQGNQGGQQQEKTEPIKVYYLDNAVSSRKPSDPAEDRKLKDYIIELTGISPEPYIPTSGAEAERLNLLMASPDEPLDMFIADYRQYVQHGAIQPINDLLDKYGADLKKWIPQDAWDAMTDKDGNIWGVPRGQNLYVNYPLQIRTDWLEKTGLSMPTTIEELEHVFQVFKDKDPSGTGSTIPFLSDYAGLINGVLGGFVEVGNGNWVDPQDNRLKPVELHPDFKDFIIKMNDWYTKGYLHKEAFVANRAQQQELLKQNKVGVFGAWYSAVAGIYADLTSSIPGLDYRVVEGMTGPKGNLTTFPTLGTTGLLIPAKSKNPEAMMQYINWQYSNNGEGKMVAMFGEKDVNWRISDEKPDVSYIEHYVDLLNGIDTKLTDVKYSNTYSIVENLYRAKIPGFESWVYLQDYVFVEKPGMGKRAPDYGIVYDTARLAEEVPTYGDIQRMLSEEPIKFITGQRPLAQFDAFISELDKVGMQDRIDAYTRQYNELKK